MPTSPIRPDVKTRASGYKVERQSRKLVIPSTRHPGGCILFFDQGIQTTGFAVLENDTITQHGIIKLGGKSYHHRFVRLMEAVNRLIDEYTPDAVIYEVGGAYGGVKTAEARRGMIISEFAISHTCFLRQQNASHIQNEQAKYAIADKQRLMALKQQRLRNSLRPIKEDAHEQLNQWFKLPPNFWMTPDHADACVLAAAYARHPDLANLS